MASKLKPPSVRRHFKEKVVQMYEDLLHETEVKPISPRFWEDLFLLKPKMSILESEINKCSTDQLVAVRSNINMLFNKCVSCLSHDHHIRVVNSLMTLSSLVRGLYKKMQGDYGFDFINILIGFDSAEEQMQVLLNCCSNFLIGDYSECIKSLTLNFLLVLVTGTDNVNQNIVLEYLTINCNFETIIQLLNVSHQRHEHGSEVVLFLMLMVNYRKYEMANPYTVQLSILDDDLILTGYGQIIRSSLADFNSKYSMNFSENSGSGWFASLTSMVGSMFISEEMAWRSEQIKANDPFLLALYEAVHLNRNFITALITATNAPSSPTSQDKNLHSSTERTKTFADTLEQVSSNETQICQPTNLLVTFLEYCSIVMQDTKTDESANNVKLCFLILVCITEDQYSNMLLHDLNLVFTVPIHKVPMRHRKVVDRPVHAKPLACAIFDIMVEFVMTHMLKKLPYELLMISLGIIHRLLVYQKRNSVRLNYNWRELWAALISLCKFVVSYETNLAKKMDIFLLAHQAVNVINLFITYGDTFLSAPSSYDELYYEIMRMQQNFENLYSMSLRYSRSEGEHKESALKLSNSLSNIRAIINHFTPKLDKWHQEYGVSTEEQVLELVRSNYDSLTLKLNDCLDQFEKYNEKVQQSSFFSNMVRNAVIDVRQTIEFNSIEGLGIGQELTSSA